MLSFPTFIGEDCIHDEPKRKVCVRGYITIKLLLSSSGGLFILSLFEGGRGVGGWGGLFNLEKTMVSVLH